MQQNTSEIIIQMTVKKHSEGWENKSGLTRNLMILVVTWGEFPVCVCVCLISRIYPGLDAREI